jgi:hypothetical protein
MWAAFESNIEIKSLQFFKHVLQTKLKTKNTFIKKKNILFITITQS